MSNEHTAENEATKEAEAKDGELKDQELEYEWVFWFDKKAEKGATQEQFENALKQVGSFRTIQEFWRYFDNFTPELLRDECNIRMFKSGIKPVWECPENIDGGKWLVPCPQDETNQSLTHDVWTELLLAVIGEQFDHCEDVCGIVLSVRTRGNTISVWNHTGADEELVQAVTAQIKAIVTINQHQNHSRPK
eukprot:c1745_g1_i2.p1 GENE.c1745_g1_i2~~c1745_g1_i2.p1  ORF type:complete len:191 (-),score=37.14 c1745_g1_i2:85-657(-)